MAEFRWTPVRTGIFGLSIREGAKFYTLTEPFTLHPLDILPEMTELVARTNLGRLGRHVGNFTHAQKTIPSKFRSVFRPKPVHTRSSMKAVTRFAGRVSLVEFFKKIGVGSRPLSKGLDVYVGSLCDCAKC